MPYNKKPEFKRKYNKSDRTPLQKKEEKNINSGGEGLIRLNKFIANAGICSRREADRLIVSGVVKVNGTVVKDLGVKISPEDKVQFEEQTIKSEKKFYVLLNKPKGYITTTDDPFDRKTVMFLVKNACNARIYPVGRLDRDTTGVLLLTNDGDLAKKLTHPRHRIIKIYHVILDKNLKAGDLTKIAHGIELDDGLIKPDAVSYVQGADKKEVGIEIHSGKNRVIRRIFESLGYKVTKLDRVSFAGLTKKDVPRGKWRHLNDKEVSFLKMK
jgi:23S rRNA pseudouridine2605 synthase